MTAATMPATTHGHVLGCLEPLVRNPAYVARVAVVRGRVITPRPPGCRGGCRRCSHRGHGCIQVVGGGQVVLDAFPAPRWLGADLPIGEVLNAVAELFELGVSSQPVLLLRGTGDDGLVCPVDLERDRLPAGTDDHEVRAVGASVCAFDDVLGLDVPGFKTGDLLEHPPEER